MTMLSAVLATLFYFDQLKLGQKMTKSLKLYWLLWDQSIVFAFVVDAAFWILLYKDQDILLDDILIHVTNFLVLGLDLFVIKHPSRHANIFYIILVEISYMIFTAVYQLLGGLDK